MIPLIDVSWQHFQVRREIEQGLAALLSDQYCDGSMFVRELEETFSHMLGPGILAVGTQSGLAAEFLILKAMGIGPGDEVITVPNSDLATTAAISHTGAQPVLVDIDPKTHNIDPLKIKAAVTGRTKAIVAVHMYGLPAEMDAICAVAREYNLKVIEDAALALGAEYYGRKVGALGDAAFFSFAPRKILGGLGNGGMVTTRDSDLAYKVRLLRGYGLLPRQAEYPVQERLLIRGFEHVAEGYNLRLDGINAITVKAKLAHLEEWHTLREKIADRYNSIFANVPGIELPGVPPHTRHAWRNYVVKVQHRDDVRAKMLDKGITTAVFYTPPVHLQPVYRHLGLGPGSFPAAEATARSLLCLPIYPGLSEDQVDFIAMALIQAVKEASQ